MTRVKKILLTDDDKDDRDMFSEALAAIDPGIVYHWAEHGKDALHLLDSKAIDKPDIIFIDINMPVMDGWELLTKLKTDNSYRDVPVVMYTTSSEAKDRKIAMELGALSFVTKPDNFKSVKKLLQLVVQTMENNSLASVDTLIGQMLSQGKNPS